MVRSSKNKMMFVPLFERIVLVGVGGTGSVLAELLCRLIKGHRLRVGIVLIDGDSVEDANIWRQNFEPAEVGHNKAEAIAFRMCQRFGMELATVDCHIKKSEFDTYIDIGSRPTLVITATDNLLSRRAVAESYNSYMDCHLWLDVGNELEHGQAILGSTHKADLLRRGFWQFNKEPFAQDLPDIAALNPAILKARKQKRTTSCAEQPFAQQGFGVNQQAALAASMIVRQILVNGEVRTPQIYFNVADGRMAARAIDQDMFRPWKRKDKESAKKKQVDCACGCPQAAYGR